jgi:hypothetical protein
MSVYYFDGAQILAPLTIKSNEPVFEVETLNLRKQRASQNVQRWEISFSTIGTAETQADIMLGAISSPQVVQTMIMPQLPSVDEATTINKSRIAIGAGAPVGANAVAASPVGVFGIIPKGTFFKFSNHDKLYVTTSDTSVASLSVMLNFYPSLQMPVVTSQTIEIKENAILTFQRDLDNQRGITFTDGVLSNAGTITLIEAL